MVTPGTIPMERRGDIWVPRGIEAPALVPVPKPAVYPLNYYPASLGAPKAFDDTRGVNYYTSHVYSACEAIAKREAGLKWTLVAVDEENDDAEDKVTSHPFVSQFMRRPNALHSWRALIHLTSLWRSLTGNAYWLLIRDPLGTAIGAWPLLPQLTRVVIGGPEFVLGYNFYPGGLGRSPIFFPRSEVVHFRLPNPGDPYGNWVSSYVYGYSRVRAAAYDIDSVTAMDVYDSKWFKNECRPDFAIAAGIQGPNQEAEMEALFTSILIHHQGADNWGLPMLLPKDSKIEQINFTARDQQWIERASAKRDDIFEVIGVSKFMLGRYENINRSVSEEAARQFNVITIKPDMDMMADDINTQLIQPNYSADQGLRIEARFENPVAEDFEQKLKKRESDLGLGIVTIDECRAEDGKDPHPNGIGAKPTVANTRVLLEDVAGNVGQRAPKPIPAPVIAPNGVVAGGQQPAKPGATAADEEARTRALAPAMFVALEDPSQREMHWRSAVPVLDQLEAQAIRVGREVFKDQRARVMAHAAHTIEGALRQFAYPDGRPMGARRRRAALQEWLRASEPEGVISAIFDDAIENAAVADGYRPVLRAIYREGGKAGSSQLGVIYDVTNSAAVEWLQGRAAALSLEVNTTTKQRLLAAVARGIEEGKVLRDIVGDVGGVFDALDKPDAARLRNIARTETTGGYNRGLLESWLDPRVRDLIAGAQWITAHDNVVRTTHRAQDGDVQALGDRFANGCAFPGDPTGDPEEICGCRCTIRAVRRVLSQAA